MDTIRFIMLGGFLGAGKTTTIARLARHFTDQGKRVGIVTNDQADNLVDTNTLRGQGFAVNEVPGACFCCRFDELIGQVERLGSEARPDIVLAEPVGSCTDLVATVVQPLKDLYGVRFLVAPYAVLFKPSHGLRILKREASGGFSPKAEYIFRKQLEEADAIVLNRADEMSPEDLATVRELVSDQFPGRPVLVMSARTGTGFEGLIELLGQEGEFGRRILDIDYDTYAEGEAELGWLNTTAVLTSPHPFAMDDLLMRMLSSLGAELERVGGEVAHLKLIGMTAGGFGVANLVHTGGDAVLSLASHQSVPEAELVVNARVAMDPDQLDGIVRHVVTAVCAELGVEPGFRESQSLRPGRPVPTHRYSEARG